MADLELSEQCVLVTGAAGFIGAFLCKRLLEEYGARVIGLDSMTGHYDVGIKQDRLHMLAETVGSETDDIDDAGFSCGQFSFIRGDLTDQALVESLFETYQPDIVVHLGAQSGVRYSLENPRVFAESNLIGFFNILESCRLHPVKHLVFASSSSVYAGDEHIPFSEDDRVDAPVSLYAATKRSDELMAHAYSQLYSIPTTGLRFFTVYGPMGRPDMAYFSFTDKLVHNETIRIFNYGNCERDFTYIDDIIEGVIRVMQAPPKSITGADGQAQAPYRLYNIGNSSPVNLMDFIDLLGQVLIEEGVLPEDFKVSEHLELVPMQPGDVPVTFADTSALERDFGFRPLTKLEDGLRAFARWYKTYYRC